MIAQSKWRMPGFRDVFNRRMFLLALTMLSAVAFSFSTLFARFFSKESLPDLIHFQTTAVFLAFIVQSGLRAGMRNQHHLGRRRVVQASEKEILRLAPWIGLSLSAIVLSLSQWQVFPAYSVLQAVLSLLMCLRIAQHQFGRGAVDSFLLFSSIVAPCSLIIFSNKPLLEHQIAIEAASVLSLFLLSWGKSPGKLGWRALVGVFRKSIGLQVGAFAIYLLTYVFGQYVVFLSRLDLDVAVAYAEIQVICGVQGLIYSRIYLFIEGSIVKKGKIQALLLALLGWSMAFGFIAMTVVGWLRGSYQGAVYAALSISILGREALGLVVQFMKDRYRMESLIFMMLCSLGLGTSIYLEVREIGAIASIAIFSPAFVSLCLAIRSYFSDSYFIRPAATDNG